MIPVSKIVNVTVQVPKQYVLECRMKAFDEMPEVFLCCEQKIVLLKRISSEKKIVLAYPKAHEMHGWCIYCDKSIGDQMVLHCVTPTPEKHVIPVGQYDINEVPILWPHH